MDRDSSLAPLMSLGDIFNIMALIKVLIVSVIQERIENL